MSLADNDYGHIYMQFGDTDPEKVANSFTEFLEGLEYDEQTIIISKSILIILSLLLLEFNHGNNSIN